MDCRPLEVCLVSLFVPSRFTRSSSHGKFFSHSLSASDEGRGGWASLSVHGFENSPISWNSSAHGCLDGGENGYTVLRLPLGEGKDGGENVARCMIYEVVGSQDEHS